MRKFFSPRPRLSRSFQLFRRSVRLSQKWLQQFDLIFSQKNAAQSEWKYYLEGGIQNFDAKLYALPRALAALQAGRSFVHRRASSTLLDVLAKSLRLRGYNVETA